MAEKKVVIYTTPTCPWCRKTKEYLAQKGITYEERNVAADKAAAREMIEKSKQMTVPVVVIGDDDIVVGYNQATLDKLLK